MVEPRGRQMVLAEQKQQLIELVALMREQGIVKLDLKDMGLSLEIKEIVTKKIEDNELPTVPTVSSELSGDALLFYSVE